MSTVETFEYHESCPGCGASNDGSGVCPYCGGSMIKSRRVANIAQHHPADGFFAEDRSLPVIKGKSAQVNTFLKFFCPLFGGIFIAVPTFLFVAFASMGLMEIWLVGFFSIFWVIGFGALVPLFVSISRNRKCKTGKQVIGTVRSYSNSNVSVNGSPALNIRVRVEDNPPYLVQLYTGENSPEYPIGCRVLMRTTGDLFLIEGPVL